MGPTVTRPGQDPLAVSLLDNRLYILLLVVHYSDPYVKLYKSHNNCDAGYSSLPFSPKKDEFFCQLTWDKVGKLKSQRNLVKRPALNMNGTKKTKERK